MGATLLQSVSAVASLSAQSAQDLLDWGKLCWGYVAVQYEYTVEVVVASAELLALSDEVTILRLGQLVRRGTSRFVANLRIV